LFPKTPPVQFWLKKYREADLQEMMRRRRLTLAPIPKEHPDDCQRKLKGERRGRTGERERA
jgi:hypothetical protein